MCEIHISAIKLNDFIFILTILQCKKITLTYCNWGGSSRGMRELLANEVKSIATKYPDVEFVLKKKSGHPIVQAEYVTGATKTICVRNRTPSEIKEKIQTVHDSRGEPTRKYKYPVKSANESVRGVWSPFHTPKDYRFKI